MATATGAVAMRPTTARVSVIIVSHNEGDNLARTVRNLASGLPAASELVVVDDWSTDASADSLSACGPLTVVRPTQRLGSARARNFGAAHAQGDVLVFSDAHVEAPPNWADSLLTHLARPEVGAVGPAVTVMGQPEVKGFGFEWADAALTWRWLGWQGPAAHPVPMLGGFFLAMRREVFEAVGGFDPGIVVWGSEDAELSLRIWTHGYECVLVPTLEVAHLFRIARPYAIDWQTVFYNTLRLVAVHFGRARAARVVGALGGSPDFAAAHAALKGSDVWQRRSAVHSARTRDAEWFFQRFGIAW